MQFAGASLLGGAASKMKLFLGPSCSICFTLARETEPSTWLRQWAIMRRVKVPQRLLRAQYGCPLGSLRFWPPILPYQAASAMLPRLYSDKGGNV
jgi:hypothetical protein